MLMMPLQGDMLHRGFKHSVMKFKIKGVLDAIQNFLGVEINQVLIRKYEVTGADWNIGTSHNDEEGRELLLIFF